MQKLSIKDLTFWFNHRKTLFSYFKKYQLGRNERRRLFWNNKSKILLVSHIDTVQEPKINRITKKRIYAAGLDDRLGCALSYRIMRLIHVDLLICDHEEFGASTAKYHKLNNYNFIIELDRCGVDFVNYTNLANSKFVEDFSKFTGRELGFGSYSDICSMNTKIGRINVGIGYYKDHAIDSYAVKKEINQALNDVIGFIKKYGSIKYKTGPKVSYDWQSSNGNTWQKYYGNEVVKYTNSDTVELTDEHNNHDTCDLWVCVHCNNIIEENTFYPPICCGDFMKSYDECYRR